MSVKADNPIILGLSYFNKLCNFTKMNIMTSLLNKLKKYFKTGGIDLHLKELRDRVSSFNGITQDVLILEQAIENIEDNVLKDSLKRNLLDHLQYLTQKDDIDRAW
ncbi:hypothetical protein SAMN05421786_11556 [Chryseobacterium ureilyticum]|uniref:Uncharacterized protein n=1 Tax=Chryseobacterium ureilyticum TaxID=373668 RepID=A0A1N7QS27_9FLAO|nr:hypothetical protein [Chryseobacterium ureilyticum]SIT25683.1 hypothetical protein SAMN05421786_11556 [Chryseobacterium ureilyticum]